MVPLFHQLEEDVGLFGLGVDIGLPLISVPKVPVGFLDNSSSCSEFL
jgi:hypothetical protein